MPPSVGKSVGEGDPIVPLLERASQKPARGTYPSDSPVSRDFSEELSGQVCKVSFDKDSQQMFVDQPPRVRFGTMVKL